MHSITRFTLYITLFVVCLVTSCKNEKSYSTISLDSMLMLDVEVKPGGNIVPFCGDTTYFAGFPGAIAIYEDIEELPFLIIGKNLDKKSSLMCHFVGTIEIQTDRKHRVYAIAMPVSEDYATTTVESYVDLSTNHSTLKLWLQDYFKFAFSKERVQSVKWNNELDVLRRLERVNN